MDETQFSVEQILSIIHAVNMHARRAPSLPGSSPEGLITSRSIAARIQLDDMVWTVTAIARIDCGPVQVVMHYNPPDKDQWGFFAFDMDERDSATFKAAVGLGGIHQIGRIGKAKVMLADTVEDVFGFLRGLKPEPEPESELDLQVRSDLEWQLLADFRADSEHVRYHPNHEGDHFAMVVLSYTEGRVVGAAVCAHGHGGFFLAEPGKPEIKWECEGLALEGILQEAQRRELAAGQPFEIFIGKGECN